ncbi:MAG: hypothetical protein DI582_06910 [Azospirillum brasilense]|nr:MAG: hypothetical protein DI582_06910 [Azospirillum brasilense]
MEVPMYPSSAVLRVWLSCCCVILLLVGAPQAASASSAIPSVVVTTEPLKPLVDALLKGITESTSLTRPGQDAHVMSLSPSQMRALDKADLIILPDRAMNPVVSQLLDKHGQSANALVLTELDVAEPLPYPTGEPWLGEKTKPSTNDAALDPHLWMDPLRMAQVMPVIAETLAEVSPQNAALIRSNAQALEAHLRTVVHPNLQRMLAPAIKEKRFGTKPFIPYVTAHRAYQYFFARYGLKDYGALHERPEEFLGARSSRDLLKRAGEVEIGCLLAEQDSITTTRVAQASGAKLVHISPEFSTARTNADPAAAWVSNDYDALLHDTALQFADCLKK